MAVIEAGGYNFLVLICRVEIVAGVFCIEIIGGVAQLWLERRPVTPEAASSSLVVPANDIKGLGVVARPFFFIGK